MEEDYKKLYTSINILRDDTNGLVSLYLVERHGQDRATKVNNNFTAQSCATDSRLLLSLARMMDARLPKPSNGEIVLGMMVSGVIMSGYLALARGSKFCYSIYDKNGDYNKVFQFTEDHRDKTHYIYGIRPGDEVVIVEDEITTGKGVIAFVHALRAYDVNVNAVISVNEIVNFGARKNIRQETGIELISLMESELIVV